MKLKYNTLTIRLAIRNDAEYLCKYWHESAWNISIEDARESLDSGKEQHMIEVDGKIIGDIHYGEIDNKTAEIGIYIRDEAQKGKGYGIIASSIFIDALFNFLGYDKIRIATSVSNKAMRYISENKFGLTPFIHEDAYQELTGTSESYAEYILKKDNWRNEFSYVVLN